MCGILVIHSKNKKLDLRKCRESFQKLDHRGPDYSFDLHFTNENLYLGQTVLSITGSPDKELKKFHQSSSGRYEIIFNGEIYNFKSLKNNYLDNKTLFTKTDTEVLVNLHDILPPKELFKKLSGMYAYVCLDKQSKSLIIGRDVIGEKCIYKYEDDELMILSSEIKPIINYIGNYRINNEKIFEYFFTRHLLIQSDTPIKNIEMFPPGELKSYCLLSSKWVSLESRNLSTLINLDLLETNKSRKESDLLDELDSLFLKNAFDLMPSVNYGSVFSGGIDSSLASAYMLQTENKPDLYCLRFGKKDSIINHIPLFEKRISKQINILNVTEELFAEHLKKSYEYSLLPIATHSFASQQILSEQVKHNKQKVLIGGDGADELFGGYEAYKKVIGNFEENINPSPYSGFVDNDIRFNNFDMEVFSLSKEQEWLEAKQLFSSENGRDLNIQTVLYLDSFLQLESVGLRASDLMSMVNSVESRGFFVTHDVMSFAINLPAHYKINLDSTDPSFITKPLLKKLFIRYFGKDLLFPKQGFSGFPNESANKLLNQDYSHFEAQLEPIKGIINERNISQGLEWKIMNVELFLRSIKLNLENY